MQYLPGLVFSNSKKRPTGRGGCMGSSDKLRFPSNWSKKGAPTWKDPQTGLEWQGESPGRMTWHEGREYAAALSLNGRIDWRLPSLWELETLLDRTEYRPVMRRAIPFRDKLSYWSSTTFEDNLNNAWIIMFDGAYLLSYYKSNLYYIRCVRGGPSVKD